MAVAGVMGQFLLAAVFAVAGTAKLRDLSGSRRAVRDFGVAASAAVVLGTLLPLGELAIAGALLVPAATAVGSVAALALLLCFCVAITWNLARGRAPDCHCFGQLHSAPATGRTVARNIALALVALVVAAAHEAWAPAVVVGGLGGVGLLTMPVLARRRRGDGAAGDGLPLGAVAPEFRLPALAGGHETLSSLRAPGLPVLLLFTDPHCGPCVALAPEVARWQREHGGHVTIAVVERDPGNGAGIAADEHGRRNVLLQTESEVADRYRAAGTPTAVLVGSDGVVASPVAAGRAQIEAVMAQVVSGFEPEERTEPAPRAALPALRRREVVATAAGAWAAAILAAPGRAADAIRETGPRAGGGCAPGHHRCGERCCGPRQRCVRRGPRLQCVCPPYAPDKCGRDCSEGPCGEPGSACADFDSDVFNCGGCREPECPPHTQCVRGDCVEGDGSDCGLEPDALGRVCCEGRRSTLDDVQDCGRCGNRCRGKRPECCNGRCVDLHADPNHCGGCLARPCGPDQVCFGGRCRDRCPPGTRRCGRTCGHPRTEYCCRGRVVAKEDAQSDNRSCGSGCRNCGDYDCCNGKCCDYNNGTCCPDGCTNTSFDDNNCGGCGNVCKPNEYCRFGVCTCPLGQAC